MSFVLILNYSEHVFVEGFLSLPHAHDEFLPSGAPKRIEESIGMSKCLSVVLLPYACHVSVSCIYLPPCENIFVEMCTYGWSISGQ